MRKNHNFKKVRTSNRLTQKDMAEILGVKQSFISDIENGNSALPYSKAKILSLKFGVDIDYLMGDHDLKEKDIVTGGVSISLNNKNKEEITPLPYDDYMMVEYVDLSASAGMLGGSDVDILPDYKKRLVPKEFDNGNYIVVRVNGDSMTDGTDISIPDGVEILVKEHVLEPGDKLPIRGNLFVICSREGNVFKQIVEHNTDLGYIRCHSYNPKYEDYNIPMDDVFQIFIYRKIVGYRPNIPEIR